MVMQLEKIVTSPSPESLSFYDKELWLQAAKDNIFALNILARRINLRLVDPKIDRAELVNAIREVYERVVEPAPDGEFLLTFENKEMWCLAVENNLFALGRAIKSAGLDINDPAFDREKFLHEFAKFYNQYVKESNTVDFSLSLFAHHFDELQRMEKEANTDSEKSNSLGNSETSIVWLIMVWLINDFLRGFYFQKLADRFNEFSEKWQH